jgi:uncharacterized protein (TIGR02284 family)
VTAVRCPTDERIIATLRELIQINLDSFNGFKQASEELHDAQLARRFQELSRQSWQQAEDLQRLLVRDGEERLKKENVSSRIRRTIMDWRRAFGTNDLALLHEAERGEAYVKAKYEAALSRSYGSAISDYLNYQYARVQAAHEWLASVSAFHEQAAAVDRDRRRRESCRHN